VPPEAPSRAERRSERQSQRRRRKLVYGAAGGVAAVVIAVVAVVALSGGDDTKTKATAKRTKVSTSTSATAGTTSATTTTTAPAGPIPKSTNPVVALAQQYDGYYSGTFANNTFSTTGTTTLELRIDPNTGEMLVKARFDGDLFGNGDKSAREIEGTVKLGGDPNAPITTDTKSFGPVTGRLDGIDALALNAPDVPEKKVKSFDLRGTIKADYSGFDSTYTVTFDDGSTAEGTVSITCDAQGQRPSDVTTLCSPA
jgi:hypothetical protein